MTLNLLTGELISDLIYVGGSEHEVIKTVFSLKVHKYDVFVFCSGAEVLLLCFAALSLNLWTEQYRPAGVSQCAIQQLYM